MTDEDESVLDSHEVSSVASLDRESVTSTEGPRRRPLLRRRARRRNGEETGAPPASNHKPGSGAGDRSVSEPRELQKQPQAVVAASSENSVVPAKERSAESKGEGNRAVPKVNGDVAGSSEEHLRAAEGSVSTAKGQREPRLDKRAGASAKAAASATSTAAARDEQMVNGSK